ncbi:hypothetical protein SNOG_04582 [Parastagonospora nodorum SN15]|uniref:Uncharacterized protein n=1 Tax=Phaeosphaeria nodorum (strain SN15 / ATCC MYA-4574 / FGSC 10173) TaxID=321614 RepID=Q0UUI2_PHANO|nr:hypothetical protein SNOG_04582 [Parastagonospora nodorum SN15]EAT88342.1 hypothetical protein SNOG_04582 [Parastagonospora nodorum SN15]
MVDVVSEAGPSHTCILHKFATETFVAIVAIDITPMLYPRTAWGLLWEDARKTQKPGFRLCHGTRPYGRDNFSWRMHDAMLYLVESDRRFAKLIDLEAAVICFSYL